jgi:transcriptional regulator with XRE-family HTH domain
MKRININPKQGDGMIHEIFKMWRFKNNLTMRQAAKKVGVSVPTYCRIEAGKNLDGSTLLKIINVLFNHTK